MGNEEIKSHIAPKAEHNINNETITQQAIFQHEGNNQCNSESQHDRVTIYDINIVTEMNTSLLSIQQEEVNTTNTTHIDGINLIGS